MEAIGLSQRGRVMMAFGLVFLLAAVTLVIVAQTAIRRPEASIVIAPQR